MIKNEILIVGKIPPPVGGVTVHVSRLVETLNKRDFNAFHFFDLGKESMLLLLLEISRYKIIHLHTSNPYFQLIMGAHCRLIGRKLIITYHGNWGRFGFWKNFATELSSQFAFVPILLNFESLEKAKKLNKNSVMISAFIPPVYVNPLNEGLRQKLTELRSKYKYLFCTNSSNLTFDKNGAEIYGISDLITNISQTSKSALLISDPSGTNKKYFEKCRKKIPDNILFICREHDFWNMLEYSDAFVRNTKTDGDSISIHEALLRGVTVFASDHVPRPTGCKLFTDVMEMDFERELEIISSNFVQRTILEDSVDTIEEIVSVYRKCLSQY